MKTIDKHIEKLTKEIDLRIDEHEKVNELIASHMKELKELEQRKSHLGSETIALSKAIDVLKVTYD